MPKYIEVEELLRQDFQDYSKTDVENAINSCPAADVAPVTHARWIEADKLLRLKADDITTEIRGMRAWVDLVELIEFIEKESVEGELSVKDSEEMDLKGERDAERID